MMYGMEQISNMLENAIRAQKLKMFPVWLVHYYDNTQELMDENLLDAIETFNSMHKRGN